MNEQLNGSMNYINFTAAETEAIVRSSCVTGPPGLSLTRLITIRHYLHIPSNSRTVTICIYSDIHTKKKRGEETK